MLTSLGHGLPTDAGAELDLARLLVDAGNLGGTAKRQLAVVVMEWHQVETELAVLALISRACGAPGARDYAVLLVTRLRALLRHRLADLGQRRIGQVLA